MRIEKEEWQKTFIPFVWEQSWHAYLSTAPNVNFMTGLNYKLSFRKPCYEAHSSRMNGKTTHHYESPLSV